MIARRSVDLAIIGGGPAGLAAALEARRKGCQSIVLLERDHQLGGILNQCIHPGFGLHYFKEELTGPEYAARFVSSFQSARINSLCGALVLSISPDRELTVASPEGLQRIQAGAIILAMGCRERPRGAIGIPGTRGAGVMTAGTAQRLINLDGLMPGRRIIVLGSGDIGLIMARRLTLEGAHVLACVEWLPAPSGLPRNVAQCLQDFQIPLLVSHTITEILGRERVEAVMVAPVDPLTREPDLTAAHRIACDTVLTAIGLIPENELSRSAGILLDPDTLGPLVDPTLMTSCPGIFACGNALHVHDEVDGVSLEAEQAARSAVAWLKSGQPVLDRRLIPFEPSRARQDIAPDSRLICPRCPKGCLIRVEEGSHRLPRVSGALCARGIAFARAEIVRPTRTLTTLIISPGCPAPLPVKTTQPVPRDLIPACLSVIHAINIQKPVRSGDILLRDLLGTGSSVVATRNWDGDGINHEGNPEQP